MIIKKLKKILDSYKSELEKGKEELKKVISEMSILCKTEVVEDSFNTIMSAFEKKVNELDRDLTHIKKMGTDQRTAINQKKGVYKDQIGDQTTPADALMILDKRAKTLKEVLSDAQISNSSDPSELKTKITQKRLNTEALNALKRILIQQVEGLCYKKARKMHSK